jgi:hypothetical protein
MFWGRYCGKTGEMKFQVEGAHHQAREQSTCGRYVGVGDPGGCDIGCVSHAHIDLARGKDMTRKNSQCYSQAQPQMHTPHCYLVTTRNKGFKSPHPHVLPSSSLGEAVNMVTPREPAPFLGRHSHSTMKEE